MSVEQARAALDAVLEQSMAFVDAIRLAMSSQAHADDLARHRDEQAAAHKALVECLTALDDADEDVDGDPARRDLVQSVESGNEVLLGLLQRLHSLRNRVNIVLGGHKALD
ncbi:Uncharacterized protein PBTT_02275 [Plasmodiophora brassicae]|uniref:Uncharacterized protein n=1 Tax=Plasmodiophora brassicae TaxID=37360 RepID=A0A0G4J5P7_PLABS|nr:hypothetical protein PBRA_002814 [Plasmodiophora brassicae]SPQ94954.1 unnamed protein product [Plasmodiophora brassicae]